MQYVWSPVYVDAMILRDRDTDANGSLDERLWVQQDANMNVTALVNGSGSVVERYAYDPFGSATVYDASWGTRSNSSYAWLYLHQGARYDATSGLYCFRYRDYSPTLERWIETDPIRFSGADVDLYRNDRNDPAGATDPTGLLDETVQIQVLEIVAAGAPVVAAGGPVIITFVIIGGTIVGVIVIAGVAAQSSPPGPSPYPLGVSSSVAYSGPGGLPTALTNPPPPKPRPSDGHPNLVSPGAPTHTVTAPEDGAPPPPAAPIPQTGVSQSTGSKPRPDDGKKKLVRYGSPDSVERLADDAARAEAQIGLHGVSVIYRKPPLFPHGEAEKAAAEKEFTIVQTGANKDHYTVILPKPVTQAVADKFNSVFKVSGG